jgi:hypothetical protein
VTDIGRDIAGLVAEAEREDKGTALPASARGARAGSCEPRVRCVSGSEHPRSGLHHEVSRQHRCQVDSECLALLSRVQRPRHFLDHQVPTPSTLNFMSPHLPLDHRGFADGLARPPGTGRHPTRVRLPEGLGDSTPVRGSTTRGWLLSERAIQPPPRPFGVAKPAQDGGAPPPAPGRQA